MLSRFGAKTLFSVKYISFRCNSLKIINYGLGCRLVEAGRVEDSTFMENTMQAH